MRDLKHLIHRIRQAESRRRKKSLEAARRSRSADSTAAIAADGCHQALCIRTLPNNSDKRECDYSGSRPCYLTKEAAFLVAKQWNIVHTLVDIPSVDCEVDGGKLIVHRVLLRLPEEGPISREEALQCRQTITELSFFPDSLCDGFYMLQLNVPNIESDAVPSRPVLFPVHTA